MRRVRSRAFNEPEIIWLGWGLWGNPTPRHFTMPRYATPTMMYEEAVIWHCR